MTDIWISRCETILELDQGPPAVINLMPIGEISAVDGRKWRLTEPAAVIDATDMGSVGLLIDFDHGADSTLSKTAAAGWITRLEATDGFIRAHVEWTPEGRAALSGRVYRFISPVFTHDKAGNVKRLLRAGLTNVPALPQLGALASAGRKPIMNDGLKAILTALQMPDDASAEDAVARICELKSTQADPRAFVPRSQVESLVSAALADSAKAKAERIDRRVGEAMRAGKLPPALKDWAVALTSIDEASFDDFAAKMPILVQPGVDEGLNRTFKRRVEPTGTEAAVCAALGITTDALRKHLPGHDR